MDGCCSSEVKPSFATVSVVEVPRDEMGWAGLDTGELLKAAERAFEVLITTEQNLRYQEKLRGGCLAVLLLPTTSWTKIEIYVVEVATCSERTQSW